MSFSTARCVVVAASVAAAIACSKLAGFEHLTGASGEGGDHSGDDDASLPGNAGSGGASFGGKPTAGTSTGARPSGGDPNFPEAGSPNDGTSGSSQGGSGGVDPSPSGGSTPLPSGGQGDTATGGSATGGSATGGTIAGGAAGGAAGTVGTAGSSGAGGAEVIGGCDQQLISNADFEQGRRVWTEDSDFSETFEIIKPRSTPGLVALGVTPEAGDYLAWLGGIPDNQFERYKTTLTQDVMIPADAGIVRMTGSIWIVTDEPAPGADYMVAEIYSGDNVCWLVHWWDTDEASDGWVSFDYELSDSTQLRCMRGKTVQLSIESRQDPNVNTSFFLDSLTLVANCGH